MLELTFNIIALERILPAARGHHLCSRAYDMVLLLLMCAPGTGQNVDLRARTTSARNKRVMMTFSHRMPAC